MEKSATDLFSTERYFTSFFIIYIFTATTLEAVPEQVSVSRLALEMPPSVTANVLLRDRNDLVPGHEGHAPLLRQRLQGQVYDVPRQSLFQRLHLHPSGLSRHALRGLPSGVLALLLAQ